MDAESFFSRWSRRKTEALQEQAAKHAAKHAADMPAENVPAPPATEALPPPTQEELATLTPQSDFRRFLAPGVDAEIRRSAMKKMFSDPHFNAMDGLDIYIGDYTRFHPMPAAMLAALTHAQSVLNPKPLFDGPPERLADAESATDTAGTNDTDDADAIGDEYAAEDDAAAARAMTHDETGMPSNMANTDDAVDAAGAQKNGEDKPDHDDPIQSL